METPKKAVLPWTDVEKLGILFQLVARPIPWDKLELPPGRTVKAVQVMIDKEKSKLKKANGEAGTPLPSTPATGKGKPTNGKTESAGKKRNADAVSREDLDDDKASIEAESPTASRKKSKATPASTNKPAKRGKAKEEEHESREDSPLVKEEVIVEEEDDEEE